VRAGRTGVLGGLAIVALALLAACQPDSERLPPVGADLVALQKARCEGAGDLWARVGGEGAFACIRRTRDAGQSCTRATECSGTCLARSNTCAPFDPMVGCNEVLTASGTRATLCLN
jgi:hypothetical protein